MSSLSNINSDNSILDQDNRAKAERLAIKLARLKNVAVDIEEESRDHIPMLDNVDNSYERTLNALRAGNNRVLGLLRANRRSRHLFCYVVLLVLILMIVIYLWSGTKSSVD